MAVQNRLKILEWNCRSFRNKLGLLMGIAHQYDVLILCETWVHPNFPPPSIAGFTIIHSEKRLDSGTRKMVVVSNFVGL